VGGQPQKESPQIAQMVWGIPPRIVSSCRALSCETHRGTGQAVKILRAQEIITSPTALLRREDCVVPLSMKLVAVQIDTLERFV
jgi:hypothetical protein